MRRTSAFVTSVRQALSARGLGVTARRVEGWASASLLPSARLSLEAQLDHYMALARVSGKGTDADTTALRLAASGFDCPRLRPALLRYLKITEPNPVPRLDLGPSESSDVAFALVEEVAREVAAHFVQMAPAALSKIFQALQRNARKFAERVGAGAETGETLFHSFLVNAGCYFFGGELYNTEAIAATMNANPGDITDTDLDLVNSLVHMEPQQIDRAYLELPTEQIVAMAALLRQVAPRAVSYLEADLTEPELDQVCTVVAPMLVYAVGLVRDQVCHHGLEVLAPLLVLMDRDRSLSA